MTDAPTAPDAPEAVEGTIEEPGLEAGTDLVARAEAAVAAPEKRPDYRLAMELGKTMASSGYFQDARKEAEAAVRMIIGLDLGVSPTAAMSAIHIVEGKPMVGYTILGALILNHPHYGYRILEHDDLHCVVLFTDNRLGTSAEYVKSAEDEGPGQLVSYANELGRVDWDIERAKKANLVKPNGAWEKSPRNLLLARCLSDGVKFHMPDLTTGAAIYVEGEIGGGEQRQSIMPPTERAPALATPEAEALRERARKAYKELSEMTTTLLPPGAFAKLQRDAAHSLAELTTCAEHIEDLRNSQREIVALSDQLKEALSDEGFEKVTAELERTRGQRDKITLLRSRLEEHAPDDDDATGEGGEDA